MIIKRKNNKEKDEVVTLWHVTKKEYAPIILREGLKKSKATADPKTASMKTGLPEELLKNKVYFARSLEYLGAMEPNDKRVILRIDVPREVYKTWKDVGDPMRKAFKSGDELAKFWINYVKTNQPEYYKRQLEKGETDESLYKRLLKVWNNIGPEKTMVIEKDVPAEYISIYKP